MNAPPTITFPNLPVRRIGDPFPLSAPSPDHHGNYRVEQLPGGGFVTTWNNDAEEVRAQLFDANGMRVGGEIVINTQDAGVQAGAQARALAGGGFVVTWTDYEGDAGAGTNGHLAVKAQVFSSAGAKIGAEILVNTAIAGAQFPADVTALANGNFVVVWDDGKYANPGSQGVGGATGDTSATAVKAQLFAADGSRIGGEILVNTTTESYQTAPKVMAVAGGGFGVAWHDYSNSHITDSYYLTQSDIDVRVQMFDAGGAKAGPELVLDVTEGPTGDHTHEYLASLTRLGNGNLLVLMVTSVGFSPYFEMPLTLKAQIVTPAGVKVGGEFVVHASSGNSPAPLVQILPGGGFVVAWTEEASTESLAASWVMAQLFADDGTEMSGEIVLDRGSFNEPLTGLAVLPNGDIALTYAGVNFVSFPVGYVATGFLQLFDPHLQPIGGPYAVVAAAPGSPISVETGPPGRLTAMPDGRMLMTIGQDATASGQLLGFDGHLNAAETVPFDLKGDIVIGDADAGAGLLTVTLSVPSGVLDVTAGGSGASIAGSGTGNVTITGTLAQINALLDSDSASRVTFTAIHNSAPNVTLTVGVNDNGNGGGGAQSATASLVLDIGLPPNATHVGTNGPDTLVGYGGDDIFIGLAGNDTMSGGGGSDTYYVADAGDIVIDPVSYGVDRVATSVSYTLPAAADIEIFDAANLSGTEAMDLIGNQFGQTIIGNNGINILKGNGADDVLIGVGGNDYLVGGTGIDLMYGGLGNDTYYVDAAGDMVGETVGEGFDRVAASASYVLMAGTEIELLEAVTPSATDAMDLTGNAFANTINGNAAVNILRGEGGNDVLAGYGGDDYLVGGTGNDAMYGGLGNDTYYVDAAGDGIAEAAGEGTDRIATALSYALAAGVEIETLEAVNLGGTEAFALTGNEFANNVIGNNGANTIDGKGGFDLLIGAGGADLFVFTAPLGASNVDRLVDFVHGSDRIGLEDTVFLGLGLGAVPANVFVIGAQAQDADDHLVYNPATGQLYFDFDGNGPGPQILFATLDGQPALAASDFIVI